MKKYQHNFLKELIPLAIIGFMFVVGAYFYPKMGDTMITHWGLNGPDGYGSKFVGLMLIPLITLGIYFLFLVIPHIMVFKQNFSKFSREYTWLKLLLVGFMTVIYLASIFANLGFNFNMGVIVMMFVGGLFIALGIMMPKFKRNYFVGIRTPWTLSNDVVWEKTHKFGGKVFVFMGIMFLLSSFFSNRGFYTIFILIFVSIAYIFYYSYVQFKKEERKGMTKKKKR